MSNVEKPRKTWVFVLIGVLVGGGILTGSGYVISKAVREMGPGGEALLADLCFERISQSAKAQLLYAADNHDAFPVASHWVDATWRYGEKRGPKGEKIDPKDTNESVFRCPSISAMRAGGYGYAFDSRLSRAKVAEVDRPSKQEMIFDSRLMTRNASGLPDDLLPLPLRHRSGTSNNVAFVDGSVRPVSDSKSP